MTNRRIVSSGRGVGSRWVWGWGLAAMVLGMPAGAMGQLPGEEREVIVEGSPTSKVSEVDAAYRKGDYEKAIELATAGLGANANDATLHYLRGSARVEMGIRRRDRKLIREGIGDAREAMRIGGTGTSDYYLPYLYGMTHLTQVEGKPSHAMTAMQVATDILKRTNLTNLERANLHYQRGLAGMMVRDFDTAFLDFSEAIQNNGKLIAAYMARSDALVQAGKVSEAARSFDEAVKNFPSDPLVYNNRGMFRQSQNQIVEALEDFNRSIELDGKYFVAYTNRGYLKIEGKDYASAEEDLTKSLEIQPAQSQTLNLRAIARLAEGRIEEAAADYVASLKLEPGNPVAHADLGFALYFLKKYPEARISFERAQQIDPKMVFLNPWRYSAGVMSGDAQGAGEEFAPVKQKPEGERTWFDLLTLYLMGQVSEKTLLGAIQTPDEKLRSAQQCEAHYFIGLRSVNRGEGEKARAHFQEALKTSQQTLAAYRAARLELGGSEGNGRR